MSTKTNHTLDVMDRRRRAESNRIFAEANEDSQDHTVQMKRYHALETALMLDCSADLLELHDKQSLSLDKWDSAKKMVEYCLFKAGANIAENGV